jgi:hypothetical protein
MRPIIIARADHKHPGDAHLEYVLARITDDGTDKGKTEKFVTWLHNKNDGAAEDGRGLYHGHYFDVWGEVTEAKARDEAIEDFSNRCAQWCV